MSEDKIMKSKISAMLLITLSACGGGGGWTHYNLEANMADGTKISEKDRQVVCTEDSQGSIRFENEFSANEFNASVSSVSNIAAFGSTTYVAVDSLNYSATGYSESGLQLTATGFDLSESCESKMKVGPDSRVFTINCNHFTDSSGQMVESLKLTVECGNYDLVK
jgi:hypothetical protein